METNYEISITPPVQPLNWAEKFPIIPGYPTSNSSAWSYYHILTSHELAIQFLEYGFSDQKERRKITKAVFLIMDQDGHHEKSQWWLSTSDAPRTTPEHLAALAWSGEF